MIFIKQFFIILNLIRSIPATVAFLLSKNKNDIKEDMLGCNYLIPYKKKDGVLALNFLLVMRNEFRNVFYYRIKRSNKSLAKLLQFFYPPLKDILIAGNIGGGFTLFHGFSSVVVVSKAGKNLSVYQQVTIGKNPKDKDAAPNIGDNVNIYAGAILMGNIKIGDNVEIGAGSVVTKDIPNDCVVVGNPARIIRRNRIRVDEKLSNIKSY